MTPHAAPVETDISLVVSTLGERLESLERLLVSLGQQGTASFETVVVDQSGAAAVDRLVESFRSRLDIQCIPSGRGLSLGRNIGIRASRAPVVGFPDDDCWYPPGLLTSLMGLFDGNPTWDGFACVTRDAGGALSLNSFRPTPGHLTLRTVWQAVEPALFLRRSLLQAVGLFNEHMGPGASTPFQAGEGTELLCRAIRAGASIQFVPALTVHHPQIDESDSAQSLTRALTYGRGIGLVVRRSRMPPAAVYEVVLRPLPGAAVALATGNRPLARRRWHAFRGRLGGYLARSPGDAPSYRSHRAPPVSGAP